MAKPSSFAFVTFSDIKDMRNASTKTQIKRHAMKDIGATRRRPYKGRKRYIELPLELLPAEEERLQSPQSIAICSGAVDPFLAVPVELDNLKRELVANIFRDGQKALRQDWFTVALMADHTFYQVLANSAVQFDSMTDGVVVRRKSTAAMYFYERSISAVRAELSGPNPKVTDGLLGTVAGLVCWADIVGDQKEWNIQVKGLLQLLNGYEGGLKKLEGNKYLRSTVSWVELRGAYMQDIPCRIPLPTAWLDAAKLSFAEIYEKNPADISHIMPSAPVFDVYRTLLQRSDQIASELQRDSDDVPVWVNVSIYSLLCSRPLQNVTSRVDIADASIEETCRLGLLLFLGAVWCMRGAAPTYTWTILEKLYELSKMACISETWHGELWRVQVWLFSIAALEVATIADGERLQWHFVELLCGITEDHSNLLEISSSVLGGIPRLYEVAMSPLCEDVSNMRRTRSQEVV